MILAIMIWRRFPTSAAWLVGTLVGIKLIFAGWTVLSIRAVARAVSGAVEEAEVGLGTFRTGNAASTWTTRSRSRAEGGSAERRPSLVRGGGQGRPIGPPRVQRRP